MMAMLVPVGALLKVMPAFEPWISKAEKLLALEVPASTDISMVPVTLAATPKVWKPVIFAAVAEVRA